MDIFDIDPNALIILVIMIIGALKWVFDRLRGDQLRNDEDHDSQATSFQDLYDEARREIQLRQGQTPQEEKPRRAVIFEPLHPPSQTPASPPPLPAVARAAKRSAIEASSPYFQKPIRPKLSSAEKAALERVQGRGLPSLRSRRGRQGRSRVRQLLASPSAARDGIMLREILGPPKGLL